VARLERERVRVEAEVEAAARAQDHAALRRLGQDLAEVQTALAEAEERWLEVSEELDAH
jgi:hypothetical protein